MALYRPPRRSKQRRSFDAQARLLSGLRDGTAGPPTDIFRTFANFGPGGDSGSFFPKLTRERMWIGLTGVTAATVGPLKSFQFPKNARMVMLVAGGGGAGGGGGRTGATATNKTGGGGGGSGGITRLLIAARFLPSIIFFSPGNGGRAGAANGAGQSATSSFICDSGVIQFGFHHLLRKHRRHERRSGRDNHSGGGWSRRDDPQRQVAYRPRNLLYQDGASGWCRWCGYTDQRRVGDMGRQRDVQ